MGNRPVKIPAPILQDYNDNRQGLTEVDTDNLAIHGIEYAMDANASIEEGLSGRINIDTTYENTSVMQVKNMRSDRANLPIKGMVANHSGEDTPAPYNTKRGRYPQRNY